MSSTAILDAAFPAFIGTLGPTELIIIFLIILVLFGSTRLPKIGRGLGEGIRNFRSSIKGGAEGDSQEPEKLKEGSAGTSVTDEGQRQTNA